MKAIILAAGMGTRLGKYTKELPKCMLNFNGKSLIEWQVETLRKAGITDIIIVKGYMSEKICLDGIKYYFNEKFDSTNMVETLFCAERKLEGEVLICYADIIYSQNVLKKIIESKVDVGVTVDSDYWDYWKARMDNPEEDMESLVLDEDGTEDQKKIIDLGDTNCGIENAKHRYVGLIKLSSKGTELLKKVYHKNKSLFFHLDKPWMRSMSFKKAYMTCLIQSIINEGAEVNPIIIKRGWLEFDTVEDYERYSLWLKEGDLGRFFSFDQISG